MKKQIFEMITDIWRLTCKYQFRTIEQDTWEEFKEDGEKLVARYRRYGPIQERLCRDLFGSVQMFYQKLGEKE